MYIYLDCEFDAVKIEQKFKQRVISIGAILCDEKSNVCSIYESYVRPQNFKHLSNPVKKITNLKECDILQAHDLRYVLQEFSNWMKSMGKQKSFHIYSFGPDDARTLMQHAKEENINLYPWIHTIIDVQKIISPAICFQNQPISYTLSLDDIKQVYGLQSKVVHNALEDAYDLMQIHQFYINHYPQDKQVIRNLYHLMQEKKKMIEMQKKEKRKELCELYLKQYQNITQIVCTLKLLKHLQEYAKFLNQVNMFQLINTLQETDVLDLQWKIEEGILQMKFQSYVVDILLYRKHIIYLLDIFSCI